MNTRERQLVLEQIIKKFEKECEGLGCELSIEKISEHNVETSQGFTPLIKTLHNWMNNKEKSPWILLTDGGDSNLWNCCEQLPYKKSFEDSLIVNFAGEHSNQNIRLESVNFPLFAFDQKPFTINGVIHRTANAQVSTQVQVLINNQILKILDVSFARNELELEFEIMIPGITKGHHLVEVRSMPVANETEIWDNVKFTNIHVLPNTIGMLHLLGAPSWDGRFLRRFLKLEPKFDLISFFILRDTWDVNRTDEREMSLIQFPTERLFMNELPNFKLLIIQNFTLFQFLIPQYQQKIVEFVNEGGSLLFIGGPRSLQWGDVENSSLREILPFSLKNQDLQSMFSSIASNMDKNYLSNQKFNISLAPYELQKGGTKQIYKKYLELQTFFQNTPQLQGMHNTSNFNFDYNKITPLLLAETQNGEQPMLVGASFPNKGQVLWVFSDALWQLANATSDNSSNLVYQSFLQKSISWLLKEEYQDVLYITQFNTTRDSSNIYWNLELSGEAATALLQEDFNLLQICGNSIKPEQVIKSKNGIYRTFLQGKFPKNQSEICEAKLEIIAKDFGFLRVQSYSKVESSLADSELNGSKSLLEKLSSYLGAALVDNNSVSNSTIRSWLEKHYKDSNSQIPRKSIESGNYYWFFESMWIWLCLLALPLEVLVRKWKDIFS